MKYLLMGESQVSVVGLGTWQFGEPGWGWGSELDYETAIKMVHRALELGINFLIPQRFTGVENLKKSSARHWKD